MTRALIVGGGIAGPATAMALQHVGIDAVVFEAYPRPSGDVGSYFTLTTNGMDALRAIDAHRLAVSIGVPSRGNVMRNERGQVLGVIPFGKPLPDGTLSQTIKRTRLSRVLADEAVRRGLRIDYEKRLASASVAPDGQVVAHFEDGSDETGDLLVGADGVHSVTRRLIDPSAPSPHYVGLVNFGGYTPNATIGVDAEMWHMMFGRRAFFGCHVDREGGVVWFVNEPRPEVTSAERRSTSSAQWQQHLLDLFAGDAGPATDVIRRGRLELAGDNTYDMPRVPRWHAGPMVIIGDAAHAPAPSAGQGASMALEDAVVLAQCVRDVRGISEACATFERLRRERVERIVAQGARGSNTKSQGAFGRLMRDAMLKVVFKFLVTEKSLAWMYDYRVDLDAPVQGVAAAAV